MEDLIVKVLPLALGSAVSPVLLTVQVFILATPHRPRARAWAYTAGVAIVVALITLAGSKVFALLHRGPSDTSGVVKAVAALLLVFLAIRNARSKGGRNKALAARLEKAGWWDFMVVGFLAMILNFSSIVLFLPEVHEIAISKDPMAVKVAAYAVAVFFILLPALGPALLATVLGPRAQPTLNALNRFVTAHAKQINTGICVFFAIYLAFAAFQDFVGK